MKPSYIFEAIKLIAKLDDQVIKISEMKYLVTAVKKVRLTMNEIKTFGDIVLT